MTYVDDPLATLPYPKTDLNPLPGGADVTKYVSAADWNEICAAIADLKSELIGNGPGVFGTGVDGDLTFDGSSTVLGIVPGTVTSYRTGSIQQYLMDRDIYANNLTIDSGSLLFNDGYRVFVKGTLTLNGYIASPGANGGTGAGVSQAVRTLTILGGKLQAGGSGVVAGASSVAPKGASNSGGAGGVNVGGVVGAGTAGVAYKGGGGGSGTAAGQSGQSAGTVTVQTASDGALDNLYQAVQGRGLLAATQRFTAATGGGGGYPGTGASGQGGGGGAPVVVIANKIAGTGSLVANGGNGGNGGPGALPGSGGGGGGAGSFIVVVIGSGSFPTTDVTGGAAGAGGGTVPGGAGGAGGAGFVKLFKLGV